MVDTGYNRTLYWRVQTRESPVAVERLQELRVWTAQALRLAAVDLQALPADASFRRYFRVRDGARSFIVMDAPPPQENCRPYVQVAGLLKTAGVHAPEILAQDLARGFLLLSDLGRQSYLEALKNGNPDELFADAIDALIRWQRASRPGVLPVYDRALLRRELNLFPEWYLAWHLGVTLGANEQAGLEGVFQLLEDSALAQPQVYVHRDYMSRNLMVTVPNPGVLDFQDALFGPITYDIATLFKDAFISWDAGQILRWRRQYWQQARQAGLPLPDFDEFERACDWMGMQRHFKVLGIFARLRYRDDKRGYLEDTPRFLNYVRTTARQYHALASLLPVLDVVESRTQTGVCAS
ncbi:MAG: phosphotransferase [Gammaproteobacteria bacterium]|nr:phosphotransferase [Gammaproteobacteria bacterium]